MELKNHSLLLARLLLESPATARTMK